MLFRIKSDEYARTFDVCPAAVAVLMRTSVAGMRRGLYSVSLDAVESIQRVHLARSASTLECDHHNGWLGSCPD